MEKRKVPKSVGCFFCDKKNECELTQEIHKIAAKIELAIRSGMMIDGEYTEEVDGDRDLVMRRMRQLQEQGESFHLAIRQSKIEVIELILNSFLKGKIDADLCCNGKKKEEQS